MYISSVSAITFTSIRGHRASAARRNHLHLRQRRHVGLPGAVPGHNRPVIPQRHADARTRRHCHQIGQIHWNIRHTSPRNHMSIASQSYAFSSHNRPPLSTNSRQGQSRHSVKRHLTKERYFGWIRPITSHSCMFSRRVALKQNQKTGNEKIEKDQYV